MTDALEVTDLLAGFGDDPAGVLARAIAWDDARNGVGAPAPGPGTLSVAWLIGKHPYLGGEWYRATRPAALTCHHWGWHTAVVQQVGEVEGSQKVAGQTLGGRVIEPDVWIVRPLGRETSESAWSLPEMVDRAHAAGQKVIADLDDDIWSHEDWIAGTRPNDDRYEDWCWKVDGWLVSTRHLERVVHAHMPEHMVPVLIAPNCFEVPRPTAIPGRRIGTRLWLSGRMSADLEMYRLLFAPLLEQLDLQWVHIGREVPTPEAPHSDRSFGQLGFPLDRLIELASVAMPEMVATLGSHLSIGAICLAQHPYNAAKTLTHAVELASAGLPIVAATRLEQYRDVPGLIAPLRDAVEREVATLVRDRDYWRRRSEESVRWATDVAAASEANYLESVSKLVHLVT